MDLFSEVFGRFTILNSIVDFIIKIVITLADSLSFISRIFSIFINMTIWSLNHFTIALAIIEIFIIGITISRYRKRPVELIRGFVEYNILLMKSVFLFTYNLFTMIITIIQVLYGMIPFV